MRKPISYQLILLVLLCIGILPSVQAFDEPQACTADAGTLTAKKTSVKPSERTVVAAQPNHDIHIPDGFTSIFVLTSGEDLVIEQVGNKARFVVESPGLYTIHTLVYNGDPHSSDYLDLGIVKFGKTTGKDVLDAVTAAGICAALDVTGAPVTVEGEKKCTADAGTLTADKKVVTLTDHTRIAAHPNGDIHVPKGFSSLFVLTSGDDLVIEQVNDRPKFTVDTPGKYTIHTLVYNADAHSPDFLDLSVVKFGKTTGGDVLNLVTSAGICASLDVAGAPIRVEKKEECLANAGKLTADDEFVLLIDGKATISATRTSDAVVPEGYSLIYVLTAWAGLTIQGVNTEPVFEVEKGKNYRIHTLVYDGRESSRNFLDLSVVDFGRTKAADVLGIVEAKGLCAALDVEGAKIKVRACEADAGTLTADKDEVLSPGETVISATPNGDINVPNGYSSLFVLTSGDNLVIEQVGGKPEFMVKGFGTYTIHTLVYDGDAHSPNFLDLGVVEFGKTTGVDVLNLIADAGICASLDAAGAPIEIIEQTCFADAGTLSIDEQYLDLVDSVTISATPNGDINIPEGYSSLFVLTSGEDLVIEQVGSEPSFTLFEEGKYTIHTLVYDANPDSPDFLDLSVVEFGTTTGGDVLKLVTDAGICASLDVAGARAKVKEKCVAEAGELEADDNFLFLQDGKATLSASRISDAVVPEGYSLIYVLTAWGKRTILAVNDEPVFEVDKAKNYRIHTLVYDGREDSKNFLDLSIVEFRKTKASDVLSVLEKNGICAALDVEGAKIVVKSCEADAGTLTADADFINLVDEAVISATPNGDINVPKGYSSLFVLTSGDDLVIEQVGDKPSFTVTEGGKYTIHTLVYDGDAHSPNFLDLSVVEIGVTTGGDVLGLVTSLGLCASLDVAGAPVMVEACEADAGTLTADADTVNATGGATTISATPNGDINVPNGYSSIFVLTSGEGLVIEQVSATPSFEVSENGRYTIHTFVYNGNADSPNFLDLSIVDFGTTTGVDVLNLVNAAGLCVSLDVAGAPIVVEGCTADAGTLSVDAAEVFLLGSEVAISATPNGDINVPEGYSSLFVLTSGDDLVIEQVGTEARFVVDATGKYTIHTLVYDANAGSPDFLDLGVVEFGVTTGGDVLSLVTTAGICASLDVSGAVVMVNACEAASGTISAVEDQVGFDMGMATLEGIPSGDANVPEGYALIYVLTSGENLVIEQVNTEPSFMVQEEGLYTIHPFVFDADPTSTNFLDLSVVEFGVTQAGDVLALIAQAELCVSLDVAGAPIVVEGCAAFTGTLTATQDTVALSDSTVTLSATANGDINVPDGYSFLYVLTQGTDLVIQQVATEPSFDVDATGDYTIHTLVYDGNSDSPDFLDLGVVTFGTTTGGDVLGLVETLGICASLDVAGAKIAVVEATGSLSLSTLGNGTSVTVTWGVSAASKGTRYIVGRSLDGTIFTQINVVEEAESFNEPKTYSYVDAGSVSGATFYQVRMLNKNGDLIDTKMSRVGAETARIVNVSVYPNPSTERINIEPSDRMDSKVGLQIYNMQGQEMYREQEVFENNNRFTHEVSEFPDGLYRIVFTNDTGDVQAVGKFVKQ